MKATTDSEGIIRYDRDSKPGVSNLLTIYSQFSGKSISELELQYANEGYGTLKKDLVEIVQAEIARVQNTYNKVIESGEIYDILKAGRERATEISSEVLERVKEKVGFVRY